MRTSVAALLVLAIFAGCTGNPGSIDQDASTTVQPLAQAVEDQNATAAAQTAEEYNVPDWKPGMSWTFREEDEESGEEGQEEGVIELDAEFTIESFGDAEVGDVDYRVTLERRTYTPEFELLSLVFTDDQYNTHRVQIPGPMECRTERACLDDPALANLLADEAEAFLPLFPVYAGRHAAIHLPFEEGFSLDGELNIGVPETVTVPAGAFRCLPLRIHVELTPPDGVPAAMAGHIVYDVRYDYCPDMLQFARLEANGKATPPPGYGEPETYRYVQEVVAYDLDGPARDLASLGREVARYERRHYDLYPLTSVVMVQDEPQQVVVGVPFSRPKDVVHIEHRDPTGALVAEGDGESLLTTFGVAGGHQLRATVTGPQGILMADLEFTVGTQLQKSSTQTCNPGLSLLPLLDASCAPLTFEAGKGIDLIIGRCSHGDTLVGGTCTLLDGAGDEVASESASGGLAILEYEPTGSEGPGEWSLVYTAEASTGGTAEYQVQVLSGTPSYTNPPLPEVPVAARPLRLPIWVHG